MRWCVSPPSARLCLPLRHQPAPDGDHGGSRSAGWRLLADQHLRQHHQRHRGKVRAAGQPTDPFSRQLLLQPRDRDRRPPRSRRRDPRLRARRGAGGPHGRSGTGIDLPEPAEERRVPDQLARGPTDRRCAHLCRCAGGDRHDRLRQQLRGRSRVRPVGVAAALLRRRGGVCVRVVDGLARSNHPARRTLPAGRRASAGLQPGAYLPLRGHGHVGLVAEPLDRRGLSTCLKHRSGGVENGDRCDRRRECAGHHSGAARHVEDPV